MIAPLQQPARYEPHGRALDNPHYAYKLAWLERLRQHAVDWVAADPATKVALVGDWNVAPFDTDVWDMAVFEGQTHVSAPERAAFAAFADAGYTEVSREFIPDERKYTYWDYQRLRFQKRQGMRIDFILGSPGVAARVVGAAIDREERKGAGASDHAPVVVELESTS